MIKSLQQNKTIRYKADITEKQLVDDDTVKIVGYASTSAIDRSNDVILASAWEGGLRNYEKNPILLFNHNYNEPIGKVTEVITDNVGLKITAVIPKSVGKVFDLVSAGVLTTFSVGFMIKDADYDSKIDGLIVKQAELLEISVVSVPCNQDATFSVAKSFSTQEEFLEFRKQFELSSTEDAIASKEIKMDEDEIKALLDNAVASAVAKTLEAKATADKEAAEKLAAEKAAKEATEKAINEGVTKVLESQSEKLYSELEKRFKDENSSLVEKVAGLESALSEKSEELKAIAARRNGLFADRGDTTGSWKKDFAVDVDQAFLLARVTGKGYETDFAKQVLEKVNTHSSVSVSSADFEQEVSRNIERDIQNELILAPMFREVAMNTATMILPIMPDSGYAEVTGSAGSTTGTAPNGTLDTRGGTDRGGVALTEIDLKTVKMVAKSYLGNETEEDAIIPILPLLRESMIRQHARGVENLILLAGHADGAYSSVTAAQGLLKYASTQSRDLNTGTTGTLPALTAAGLLSLRKGMGKYGLKANDVKYIVSQRGYFELLEDPEFQDFNLVNTQATKLTGEVGQIYGSSVMVCDEFPEAAATKYYALAVNTRNFVIPRQRGVTVESDYSVEDQHRVLVTSQRLGFKEIIPNAKSIIGLKYPAAS